ncbi:hypothetical protein F2Q69_00063615 [Brassica cretica]|uniref:Uncharacterized protein n=1 Tax=Brassica cretica TaxID=69181 RepID=A0A8S9RLE9_BRACR|nr:hypothetical protein F2Q69_00063615 [Brassica cretica]
MNRLDGRFIDLPEMLINGFELVKFLYWRESLVSRVEDLMCTPWEVFDPTWEIRSETMDPWLGGYVKDMFSSAD